MNSDIVLINPYFQGPLYPPYIGPPLGLLYLASCLERRGYSVKIIDALSIQKTNTSLIKEIEMIKKEINMISDIKISFFKRSFSTKEIMNILG